MKAGTLVYAVAFLVPALFALWALMFTNYIQHVHCDPRSSDNHSRNFVSPAANWLVFDAGYHTVHHEYPGTHWSQYAELHAQRAHRIDPRLNEHSIPVFAVKNYLLGSFFPRFKSVQVGRAANEDHPENIRSNLGEIEAVELGTNAEMFGL